MARCLRELGHSVAIVASNAWGGLPDDRALGVVRVGDLRTSRLLRRLFRRGKLRMTGDVDFVERPPQALLTRVLVPELNVLTWLPAMTATVRRLLAQDGVDCLVTTSPPESSHLVGLLLGKRPPAWVADFRDGWNFEPWREPFPTAPQRRLDRWLERNVARAADAAVGATRPIARDLETRLGANAAYVPNGWDPLLAPEPGQLTGLRSSSPAIRLVYTGTLTFRGDPAPLLKALRVVNAEAGERPFRLVHAGPLTTGERALVERTGVADAFDHLGTVGRSAAIRLQRSADALVLLTSRNSSEATGKIFEYIVSGRPIVALAEANEAARIVQETNTGITVPPDDVGAIAAAFRRVASGDLAREYAPRHLERYTYPGPAIAMAEVIEEAIQRAARR
jgi:glycosyltransferase involved in cell wall biosynthesis